MVITQTTRLIVKIGSRLPQTMSWSILLLNVAQSIPMSAQSAWAEDAQIGCR